MINKTLWAAAAFAWPMIAAAAFEVDVDWHGTGSWFEDGDPGMTLVINRIDCTPSCPAPNVTYMLYTSNTSKTVGTPSGTYTRTMALDSYPNVYRLVHITRPKTLYSWIVPSRVISSWKIYNRPTATSFGAITRPGQSCDQGTFAPVVPFDIRVGETVSVVVRHSGGTCGSIFRMKGRSDDVIKFAVDELLQPRGNLEIKVTGLRPGNAMAQVTAEHVWE